MNEPAVHKWHPPTDLIRWEYCEVCLTVMRGDGKNGPCKGPRTLRPPEPTVVARWQAESNRGFCRDKSVRRREALQAHERA